MKTCVTLLLLAMCSQADAGTWQIDPHGYGPVKIGMSVPQAESLLGTRLIPDGSGPNDDCYHVEPAKGHHGLSLMVMAGRISRVSIYEGPSAIRTDRGIAVGDDESAVYLAYGDKLVIRPHSYGDYPQDKYLTYWVENGKFGVRYEIFHGTVESIHGGSKDIRLVEGCS